MKQESKQKQTEARSKQKSRLDPFSESQETQQKNKKAQKEEIKQKPKPFIYGSPKVRHQEAESREATHQAKATHQERKRNTGHQKQETPKNKDNIQKATPKPKAEAKQKPNITFIYSLKKPKHTTTTKPSRAESRAEQRTNI